MSDTCYLVLGYILCSITYVFYALCDFAFGFRVRYKLKKSLKEYDND